MSDIIKKFKPFFVKHVSDKVVTRKSFGEKYKCLLYCCKKDGKFYSYLIHTTRNLQKEPIQIVCKDEKLFDECIFEGEYYDGVFYITEYLKCSTTIQNDISNIKNKEDIKGEWEYSFNYRTFEEKYIKIQKCVTKNIVKDNNFIEIYREKEREDIIRVKDICTSKKLKNLFINKDELELPVVFNERFGKYEISL